MNAHTHHNQNLNQSKRLLRLFIWVRALAARLLTSSGSRGLYL